MARFPMVLFATVLVCASCAKGTPSNPILPRGVSPTPFPVPAYVGIGDYDTLAKTTQAPWSSGVPFVSFIEVHQAPATVQAHRDVSGFMYVAKGTQLLSREDGERARTVDEGGAAWVSAGEEHRNSNSPDAVWFFAAIRSISQRQAALPYAGSRVVYATPDLPTPVAGKPLVHELAMITMKPGGRTSAHSHGGIETFYVLEGTIELALNNGTRSKIPAGQGGSVKPGVIMQMHVVGDSPVRILTYLVTPEGEPWQTNLPTVP